MAEAHKQQLDGVLALSDFTDLIANLPPTEAAELAWAPRKIRLALDELLGDQPLTEEFVSTQSVQVFEGLHALRPLALHVLTSPSKRDGIWQGHEETLRKYFRSPAAFEAAQWAFRATCELAKLGFALREESEAFRDHIANTPSSEVVEFVSSDENAAACLHAEVLLMAILQAAAEDRAHARSEELAELAFLAASSFVKALREDERALDLFPEETQAARGERILRYASAARDVLSDEDAETLNARITDLR